MSARWESALDAQLDIYKMVTSPRGRAHVEAFAQSVIRAHPPYDRPGSPLRGLPDRVSGMAFNADPIYIDPDMQKLWEAAWPSFEPEPLAPTDLVTPYGCLLLPRPLDMTDLHGKTVSTRLILWAPVDIRTSGLTAELDYAQAKEDEPPRAGIILCLFHGSADADDFSSPGERQVGPYLIQHVMPWVFGESLNLGPSNVPGSPVLVPTQVIGPVQCLWRLMAQTIAVRTQERASRAFRKRAAPVFKDAEKRITVVRLRRTYDDRTKEPEPGSVDWSHRWIVGGHWRNQWYASVQLHRQIWISPFVKGPADKELIVNKARVFELVR
jgi:hypothetical protein